MTVMNSLHVFIPRGLRRKSSRLFEAPRERSPVLPQEDKGHSRTISMMLGAMLPIYSYPRRVFTRSSFIIPGA